MSGVFRGAQIVIENIHDFQTLKTLTEVLPTWNLFINQEKFGNFIDYFESTDEDLQKYPYLIRLYLLRNRIITNEGLKSVTHLGCLRLYHYKKKSLLVTGDGIQTLTNLTYLQLMKDTQIVDAQLKKLTNLTRLSWTDECLIDRGRIGVPDTFTDEGITTLINLTSLNLSDNSSITNEGLKKLTNLTSLDINNNNSITDEGIRYLIRLRRLSLCGDNLITDAVLKELTHLEDLGLSGNNTITIGGLTQLRNLKKLNIARHAVITDDWLSQLTTLEDLYMIDNKAITGKGFETLINLTKLDAEQDSSRWGLIFGTFKNLTNLTEWSLIDLGVIPDDVIKNLTKLKQFYIQGDRFADDSLLDFYLLDAPHPSKHVLSIFSEENRLFCKVYNKGLLRTLKFEDFESIYSLLRWGYRF